MPANGRTGSSQATISSFFHSSTKRIASPVPIDLTADDSDGHGKPPTKKTRTSRPIGATRTSPAAGPSSGAAASEQWRFMPTSPDKLGSHPNKQRTQAEALSQKERREAFKKKLLLENNRFLPKKAESPIELDVSESEESDHAFKELNEMFSNKVKGKGKSKVSIQTKPSAKPVAVTGPSGQTYTPLENQILQLKKENPGTVLLVEVGYRYRFFGEDAKIAAKELGMVAFNDRNFLVASIPVHRGEIHLKKLLSQGYRVGLVNQIETAALKKVGENRNTPFVRKLTRLYTAATYVDEIDSVDDLERYTSPPFMCLVEQSKGVHAGDISVGMVTICPSTGDVVWDDFDDTPMRIELETRLVHTRPTELLIPKTGMSEPSAKMLAHFTGDDKIRTEYFDTLMSYADAFSLVSEFYTDKKKTVAGSESFKSGRLMAEVADFPKRVVIALAHAIKHLSAFSIADAFLETKFFTKFATMSHMLLAANTLTNLEIYRNETDHTTRGSLIWILDRTKTKFGARMLRNWVGRPLTDKRILQDRVDAVQEILASSSEKLVTLRQILRQLPDLARGLCRIQYGQCTPQELAVLLPAFNKIGVAFDAVERSPDVGFKSSVLNDIIHSLPKLKQPMKMLMEGVSLKAAAEGSKDKMWTDPDRYPKIANADMAIKVIECDLEDELKKVRKTLRMPSLRWANVAGDEYLIEVKRNENRPIPDDWISHSKTKYLARYQPPAVKQKLEKRAQCQEMLQAEANNAFSSFLREIAQEHYSALRDAVNKLATADCLLSLAHVALQENYVRPSFTDDDTLEIVDGRHPMVEALRSDPFVPNTIQMGGGQPRSKILTGPNMGGKSSCVRMIALIAIMAQIGSYVPASSVKLGLLDSILTRMGGSDDLVKGRSTFMVEMTETSEILRSATRNSLVILDELGRGTATFDGMAIADAVLHQLVETTKCKTLFITHYPLVASDLESRFPLDIQNLHMGYQEVSRIDGTREIIFLYRLTSGIASESFGIECGRLAGLPESLLTVASKRSSALQRDVQQRTRQKKTIRIVELINRCLSVRGTVSSEVMDELQRMRRSIMVPNPD